MRVVGDFATFLAPHHLSQFAVCLEADQAIDNVYSCALQLSRPGDVVPFVKSRLDFHERQDGLACLCCGDQGPNNGGIAGGSIQRLFDCEDVWVRRRLFDKRLNAGGERFIGMVHEHLCVAKCSEQIRWRTWFGRLKGESGGGDVFAVLEVSPRDAGDLEQLVEPENSGQSIHLTRVHS